MDQLKRGDVVVVALAGDYTGRTIGSIQRDARKRHGCPGDEHTCGRAYLSAYGGTVARERSRSLSQLMIDKVTTVSRTRIAQSIGRLEDDLLLRVSRALALWVGIAT